MKDAILFLGDTLKYLGVKSQDTYTEQESVRELREWTLNPKTLALGNRVGGMGILSDLLPGLLYIWYYFKIMGRRLIIFKKMKPENPV